VEAHAGLAAGGGDERRHGVTSSLNPVVIVALAVNTGS